MDQIYKSLTCLLIFILLSSPIDALAQTEAQRITDLELHILSPLDGAEIVGAKIIIKFEAENHGPDNLYKGDTLFVGFLGGTYYIRVLENDLKKGERLKVLDELLNVDGYNSYGITAYLVESNAKVKYMDRFLTTPWIDLDSVNNVKSVQFKNVEQPSSIHQSATLQGLTLYPNPANQHLYLQGANNMNGGYQLRICDITGKLIQEQEITMVAGSCSIPVSLLPAGIYTVSVASNASPNSALTCRFVKQ